VVAVVVLLMMMMLLLLVLASIPMSTLVAGAARARNCQCCDHCEHPA
jgi:hypothetical protein